MKIEISINETSLYNAMEQTGKYICDNWFNGNQEAYSQWAGDRLNDGLLDFMTELAIHCGISIQATQE